MEPVLLRLGLAFFVVAVALYFVPSIIAAARGHHQLGPILVINFLLGWTFLGWVVALAWSVSHIPDRAA
jgi:hypothetical protein